MNHTTFEKTQFNDIMLDLESYCLSTYSKQLCRELLPSANLQVVQNRLQETAEAKTILQANLHMPFMGLSQVEYLTDQVKKGFVLEVRELVEYADFLRSGELIKQFMNKNQATAPLLATYSEGLISYQGIAEEIYQDIKHNQISSDATRELRKIRRSIEEVESEIQLKLAKFLRHSDNRNKIQEFMVVQKNQRFTIPVKAAYKNQLSGTVIDSSAKGTTVFMEPSGVAKLNDQLMVLKMSESGEVYQVQATLTGLIAAEMVGIEANLEAITHYDLVFARGKYSQATNGTEPTINRQGRINLKNVKHPLLGEQAVPLNVKIGEGYHGLTITGPNAGGKTVVLKTLALVTLQTMLGLQIQGDEGTEIALFDGIFVDIGDQQNLSNALSTFSGHLNNIASILTETPANSLILLDEIGSGTEPNEGAALAIAIMEAFYQKGATVVTTTHYGEIKRFSEDHPDFETAAMAFESDTLAPKYQLLMGETGESHAFWLAEKMAINETILRKAESYLVERNYDFSLRSPQIKEKTVVTPQVTKPRVVFGQGDRVRDLATKEVALVYDLNWEETEVTLYLAGTFKTVQSKRVELLMPASELYPADYDLSRLFVSYESFKEHRDLERGSKKAQKKLDRAARKRRLRDED